MTKTVVMILFQSILMMKRRRKMSGNQVKRGNLLMLGKSSIMSSKRYKSNLCL
jgi:hypothetical protein